MSDCYFYVLALAPDLKPERVKMGVARCVASRLRIHRTASPTAQLLAFWPCDRHDEARAITAGAKGCNSVGGEVFDVDSVQRLLSRLENHFGALPQTCEPKPATRPLDRFQTEERVAFEEAMNEMAALGVSATDFAAAVGVTLNSISRARMVTEHRRPPPRDWRAVAHRFLTERAAAINALASKVTDA